MEAQFTLRGATAHIQVGVKGDYEKFDTPATPAIQAAFSAAKAAGITRNSLYGSDTQYAPLRVETAGRKFLFDMPKVPVVADTVLVYSE